MLGALLLALSDLYYWTLARNWRTWVAHAVLAALLALCFGTAPALVFYLLREAEQVGTSYLTGAPQDWPDHAGDVAAPLLACAVLRLWLGL